MDGEVEQGEEGHLGAEEVLIHVRREVELGEQAVRRRERTRLDVDGPGQRAAHLVEMAVDLLESPLQALEGGGELLGIGDELGFAEGGESLGVAVLGPPALGGLLDAQADAVGVVLAKAGEEAFDGRSGIERSHGPEL
jgi:hypothetical protein